MLPGSEDAGEEADGDDAEGDDAGGEDAGGEDAGGGDDAGGEEAGGEEAGGEDAGADDAGGEEAGGLAGMEDVAGCADDWDTIGVSGTDAPKDPDTAGLRYTLGDRRAAAEGGAEDDVGGLAAGLDDAEAGEVATAPTPACGCRWLDAGV